MQSTRCKLVKCWQIHNGFPAFSFSVFPVVWYKYRKSYERKCISWFMGTSDVFKVLKIARAVGECNLRTFKTSRLYSQQNYSNALLCSCSYSSSFGFSFLSVAHVCQTFNQVFQRVFVFRIFFKLLNDVLVWQSKPTVSLFFSLWCSNLALPRCFHSNFCIAIYNLDCTL